MRSNACAVVASGFSFQNHMHPVQHFTPNIQARTRWDDTRLANANLKMNTNSPFDRENNWACIIKEKRERAEGEVRVIEALKV